MGRIKSLQHQPESGIHNLFSIRYKRLPDESVATATAPATNTTASATTTFINNNVNSHQPNNLVVASNLLMRMKLTQDYIAYCCGQCGHHQRLDIKAEDLQTIGDVLRASSSTETDAKSVKNTSWTRQFHDKSRQSKANNVTQQQPENNLKEMNRCKCGKDKALMKTSDSGVGVAGQKAPSSSAAAALVMPFHPHHPLIMGYRPLTSSPLKTPNSSSTSPSECYLPTLPVRSDSLTNFEEEDLLKCAPWFQAGIPREISLEILQQEPVGSFLVRQSTSKPGCYALSVRVPPRDGQKANIAHYLITQSNRGFKIKGFTKEFPSLTSLIVHHSVMPELLPCPLLLHRPSDGVLADYLEHANNFVDIDSSALIELTRGGKGDE